VRDCGQQRIGQGLSIPLHRELGQLAVAVADRARASARAGEEFVDHPIPSSASRLALHTASAFETALDCAARSTMRTGTPKRRSVMASDRPVGQPR
jgi:hypothetical protein